MKLLVPGNDWIWLVVFHETVACEVLNHNFLHICNNTNHIWKFFPPSLQSFDCGLFSCVHHNQVFDWNYVCKTCIWMFLLFLFLKIFLFSRNFHSLKYALTKISCLFQDDFRATNLFGFCWQIHYDFLTLYLLWLFNIVAFFQFYIIAFMALFDMFKKVHSAFNPDTTLHTFVTWKHFWSMHSHKWLIK